MHLSFICFSDARNKRLSRLLYDSVRERLLSYSLTLLILFMSLTRCEGHQLSLILRGLQKLSNLLSPMYSLAQLLRMSSYRSELIKGVNWRDTCSGGKNISACVRTMKRSAGDYNADHRNGSFVTSFSQTSVYSVNEPCLKPGQPIQLCLCA